MICREEIEKKTGGFTLIELAMALVVKPIL
jgi:prepilin-type N-terminal cleavage/methylation domain-containing protein